MAAIRRNLLRFAQAFNTEMRIAVRSWTIHWLGWLWPLLLFTALIMALAVKFYRRTLD